jgi:hypothetical protein
LILELAGSCYPGPHSPQMFKWAKVASQSFEGELRHRGARPSTAAAEHPLCDQVLSSAKPLISLNSINHQRGVVIT